MTDDDWDDDRPLEDWEYPDGEDEDELDSTPTKSCPKCDCDVYDDAEQCPLCGEYFTREQPGPSSFPVWVRATALIILAALAAAFWRWMI